MPADPSFDPIAVETNLGDGSPYMDTSAVGYPNIWAYEDGPVVPAGTTEPPTFTAQPTTACSGFYYAAFYDGVWHQNQTFYWNESTHGPAPFDALVGDAADAALAAHPDIEYFTIEPAGQIELWPYLSTCPPSYSIDGPPSATNPPPDHPPPDYSGFPCMPNDAWAYFSDAGYLDLAVKYAGVWYVDDHWGPDSGAPYTDSYPTFAGLGTTYGAETYLLRPTALTWDGQDPSNTANRIFWQRADIPDTITNVVDWGGGHPTLNAFISVRGWKLIAGVAHPVICFV